MKPVSAKKGWGTQDVIFLQDIEDEGFTGEAQVKINVNNIGPRYQVKDDISVIHLPDGQKLRIALSMEELDKRLYDTHFQDIDLCDVTGSNFLTEEPETP